MTSTSPGERPRRLERPPAERFAAPGSDPGRLGDRAALSGPLTRAAIAGLLGAAALVLVGAVLASTFGLLFVAGVMGAAIGLLLARAAVPGATDAGPGAGAAPAVSRATAARLAVAVALVAVVVADVGTWLYAAGEGGTLGLLDYLWTAFGPFVPAVAILAAVAAAWGAQAGPVQR